MFELTDTARKELDAFFAEKPEEKKNIRVYQAMSCSGLSLNMALDDPSDNDVTEQNGSYTFCIDKALLAQVKSCKIDLTFMGFTVEPEIPLPMPEGGGCATCGGCH